jgi:hypothetical protein
MDAMEAARFNGYWFLSLLAPAFVMLLVTYWRKKAVFVSGVVISLVLTYGLCNLAVWEKWDIRNEVARTKEEREYATADGANLVFTALLFAPCEAVLYTCLWGFVGRKVWPKVIGKNEATSKSR